MPGPTHRTLAALHERGLLDCCITQNIDGLHQRAGLPAERVLELHGNATRARCLECAAPYARDKVHAWLEAGVEVPACPACGGVIKPHTVLFGEAMPAGVMQEAELRARAADLFVVLGSSLVVYPAAYLPAHAQHAGGRLVIVNLEATPLDARADLVIRDRTAETMVAVLAALGHVVRREGASASWLPIPS
jgi:NAD-dependent deacetylase